MTQLTLAMPHAGDPVHVDLQSFVAFTSPEHPYHSHTNTTPWIYFHSYMIAYISSPRSYQDLTTGKKLISLPLVGCEVYTLYSGL